MGWWNAHKLKRYNQLKIDCEAKGWKAHSLAVEVGCRGYVAESFHYMCKSLGFSRSEIKDLKYACERTAMHCSHVIYQHRYDSVWGEKALLDVSDWK